MSSFTLYFYIVDKIQLQTGICPMNSDNKDNKDNSIDVNASPSKNTESIDELTNEKKVINWSRGRRLGLCKS